MTEAELINPNKDKDGNREGELHSAAFPMKYFPYLKKKKKGK